jgi:hypothetical protein
LPGGVPYRSESLEDEARRERATERASAAEELAQIVDAAGGAC